jgi:hypothetical protein
MLGVSESQLRLWVSEGKVHRPYRLRKNLVLFDAVTLAADWDLMKAEAEFPFQATDATEAKEGANPWDAVLRQCANLRNIVTAISIAGASRAGICGGRDSSVYRYRACPGRRNLWRAMKLEWQRKKLNQEKVRSIPEASLI